MKEADEVDQVKNKNKTQLLKFPEGVAICYYRRAYRS